MILTSVDLPAPFGPSRPTSFAFGNLQVDAGECLRRAVSLREATGLEHRGFRPTLAHASRYAAPTCNRSGLGPAGPG